MGASSVIEFPQGEIVVAAGASDPRVFFIQSGSIELLAAEQPVANLGKGEFFGLAAALDGQTVTLTARASTDVALLLFTQSQFQSLIQTHPEIASAMLVRQDVRLQAALSAQKATASTPKRGKSAAKPKSKSIAEPVAIVLSLADGNSRYTLEPTKPYVVGRKDPATGAVPDIDFSELAEGHTVSRQHAVVECSKGQWQLRENKPTANGSYVNDQRVAEGQAVPIKPGDKLVFGLIMMDVSSV